MLQQTTTAAAAPYFEAFTARWPTVEALAAADDADVMRAWAGLGYYARARNLLRSARALARDRGGVFPSTEAELLRLPGIGPYTAAALAAIAFDQPANVVDGNVERVMSRLYAEATPLPEAKPRLAALAGGLVAPDRPGDWAQALMDLGARVCTPRRPACGACPLAGACRARALGDPASYPRRRPKPERPLRRGLAFVALCGDQVALERRPDRGLLGGMAGVPTGPWREAEAGLPEDLAPFPGAWRRAGLVRHVFTHFALDLEIFALRIQSAPAPLILTPLDEALAAAPSLFRKAIRTALEATP